MGSYAQALQHKQALSDEELELRVDDANTNIAGFRKQLSDLAPGTTEHEQAKLGLQQAIQARTQIFRPDHNPTAMAKFGHMLLDHFPGHQAAPPPVAVNAPTISATPAMSVSAPGASLPMAAQPAASVDRSVIPMNRPAAVSAPASTVPSLGDNSLSLPQGPARTVQGPQTPQQLKAQAQANLMAGAAGGPPPGALTPEEQHQAARVEGGLDPRPAPDKAESPLAKGSLVPGKDAEGNAVMGYIEGGTFHPVAGTTVPVGRVPNQTNAAVQRGEYAKAIGKKPEDLTFDDEENMIALIKQAGAPTTTGGHFAFVPQTDGTIKAQWVTTVSSKQFGGVRPGVSPGATPGAPPASPRQKARAGSGTTKTVGAGASASGGGPLKSGDTVGGRKTSAQSKADTDYNLATKLSSFADEAAKAPTAQKEKQLALKLIKESAGRVNMQEYDIMTKKAGIANTVEQWANDITTGKLPDEIWNNLVDAAHVNLTATKAERAAAYEALPSPAEMKKQAQGNTISDDDFLKNLPVQ